MLTRKQQQSSNEVCGHTVSVTLALMTSRPQTGISESVCAQIKPSLLDEGEKPAESTVIGVPQRNTSWRHHRARSEAASRSQMGSTESARNCRTGGNRADYWYARQTKFTRVSPKKECKFEEWAPPRVTGRVLFTWSFTSRDLNSYCVFLSVLLPIVG